MKCNIDSISIGMRGFVWEPYIPDECYRCINSTENILSTTEHTLDTELELLADEPDLLIEEMDGYYHLGVKVVNLAYGHIEVFEEIGYEYGFDLEYPKTLVRTAKVCINRN